METKLPTIKFTPGDKVIFRPLDPAEYSATDLLFTEHVGTVRDESDIPIIFFPMPMTHNKVTWQSAMAVYQRDLVLA